MPYLVFELNESNERKQQYRAFLELCALGVQRSAEHLLRLLQLMAPQDRRYYHGVVFTMARHIAEEVDAVSILMEKGSIEPSKAHLRSAFEAELGIRYILESDGERRALAYHVKEIRERLHFNEMCDERSESGKRALDAFKDDAIAIDILQSLRGTHDFDAENARLRRLLAEPPYDAIDAEWSAQNKKHVNWYGLFGGPQSIRSLAYRLGKAFVYEFLYSDWSGHVHAGRALRNVGIDTTDPTGEGNAIRPIRHPDGLQTVYSFAVSASAGVAHMLGTRYLSEIGRDDLRRFYIEEIQPISRRVQKSAISAPWH